MDDETLKPIYERLDQQEQQLIALKTQIEVIAVSRRWTDEVSGILDWTERNRVTIFSMVALVGLIALCFNVSTTQRDKIVDRLTTPEALASIFLAGTGVAVAATKK